MSTLAEFSLRRVVGLIIAAAGVFLLVYPFVSVWRVGGEVLSLAPDGATEVVDERVNSAMFREKFIVARRTYPEMSTAEVETLFRTAGFEEGYNFSEGNALFRQNCCGDYDAMFAEVVMNEDGSAVAELGAADSDVQMSWPFISGLGLVASLFGWSLMAGDRRSATGLERTEDEQDLVSS